MLSLNSSGLSSYHLPFWFRATGFVTPIADDFLREFPIQYQLGFEEKHPVNPLATWYWQEQPPRGRQEYESRTAALYGALKGWLGTPR